MRETKIVESFNAAIDGFIYTMKTERNMRIHFLVGLLFILLGIYLNFNSLEIIALTITIALVLVAEMINTATELIVDMVREEVHPAARVIKDIAAGSVLVTAINAVIVGYILFSKKVPFDIESGLANIRKSNWHITFLSIVLVLGITIMSKVIFHRGTPLQGGMPSGHAAVAFSMWTIIVFMTNNSIVIGLSFVLAFLIARHRIKDAIHTFWEVFAGGVLGVLITVLLFQLLR